MRPSKTLQWWTLLAAAAAVLAAAPGPVRAQEAGVVTGRVVAAPGSAPLAGAQVFIPGTGLGTLTDDDGHYRLAAVPAGTARIRVRIIGYGSSEETVRVEAGRTARLDFELRRSTLELDEIVVTGAGVATERKKLGNTVATIDAGELETAPVSSMSEVLQGREPGLVSLPSGGLTGEGSRLRIRGSASLSQSNEPIIYVDGIRVDRGGGFGPGVSAGGGGAPSRLDDIDPQSIERIEILKGAAAATLHGTEASNGVIQIFTKGGRDGEPRWSFELGQDVIRTPTDRLIPYADFARDAQDVARIEDFWGIEVEPWEVFQRRVLDDFFETGTASSLAGSVTGGGPLMTYFVSGRFRRADGSFGLERLGPARDLNRKAQATANIAVFPDDRLRLRFNSFYSEVHHETPNNNNNIFGVFSLGFHPQLRLAEEGNEYGNISFATIRETMQVTTQQDARHFAGSVQAGYQLAPSLNLDGTFGIDAVNQRSFEFIPFGWNVDGFSPYLTEGERSISNRDHRELTVDLKASWSRPFGDALSSAFVAGTQGFLTQTVVSSGTGTDFPGPGLEVAGAGAEQSLDESRLRVVNAGLFAQEQVSYRDVAHLTVGARYDYNSAFGESAGGVLYPKTSVSLIPSDLAGWPRGPVSTLRLRAAVGRSGLQPGAFDKFTTYEPQPSTQGPGLRPANLGNPDLEPEVSTEWEAGAELGVFDDRAALDVTYWDRTVQHALVPRQFAVTGGFRATQLDNIGRLDAWGLDVDVQASLIDGRDVSVDLFVNGAYLDEVVTDMGGAPPLKVGGSYPRYRNFVREGYAPGAFFGAELADAQYPIDLHGDCSEPSREQLLAYFGEARSPDDFEVLVEDCGGSFLDSHLGKPTPDWQGAFGLDLGILDNIELSTLFEYKAGDFHVHDLSGSFRRSSRVVGRNTPGSARVEATLLDPASTAEERLDAALEWARSYRGLSPMSGLNSIYPADFLRWREASLTYRVPTGLADRLSLRSASITLSARNLHLWVNSAYPGIDPELNQTGRCTGGGLSCNFLTSVESWGVPLPRTFSLAVRAGL